jgi:uncharacterized protein (TIGR00661 family)
MTAPLTFLVCPLDWGLGHAARCVPIIRQLLTRGHKVIIAADHRPLSLLQTEFPSLEFIRLPGFTATYPDSGWMALKMLAQTPRLIVSGIRENRQLNRIIRERKIDAVISDNRFGLFTRRARCIYITHQLWIKCPPGLAWLEPLLHRLHRWLIAFYDECWIPDFPGEPNLSGDLSHRGKPPANAHFIGPLSRFQKTNAPTPDTVGYDLLAILSGPEPQRTLFERQVLAQAGRLAGRVLIVQGKPDEKAARRQEANVEIVPHLPTAEMQREMQSARVILARPGYSTIMDLTVLGKPAILVPTPGQTEQQYLADKFSKAGIYYSEPQSEFNLTNALEKVLGGRTFSPL